MAPWVGSHIEAGALLQPFGGFHHPIAIDIRTQITVSAHPADGEILLQGSYQGTQGELLLLGPRIGRQPVFVQSAFIGDTDAVLVIPPCMGTRLFQRSGTPDVPILTDVEVIAHTGHSPGPMTTEQVLLGKVPIHPGSGAMHHNQRDASRHPTHAVTTKAPANADATAMTTFKIISHTFFFSS